MARTPRFYAPLLAFIILGSVVTPWTSGASASASSDPSVALFQAPTHRHATAGEAEGVWVHTIALASVQLKADYGNGQTESFTGTTDAHGLYLFTWSPTYTGTRVTLAHYWIYVSRGMLSTSARGDFVLYPAMMLSVHAYALPPGASGNTILRLHIAGKPGARLMLTGRAADGTLLVRQNLVLPTGGTLSLDIPLATSETQRVRLQITTVGLATVKTASTVVAIHGRAAHALARRIISRSSARHEVRGSTHTLDEARTTASSAVQAIVVDLTVLAQWSKVAVPHGASYYKDLLTNGRSLRDFQNIAAEAIADDSVVQSAMQSVMPHKAIMVSIGEQAIRAYEDGRLVRYSLVTTGRPELPTVTGHFAIYTKVTPFKFTSPWPYGSPYYYPPTWITYWMPFYSGYGLHDASWRAHYGPGTNVSGDGSTSSEPTGSHGCVNMPFSTTQWLWNWAPVGTAVVVYGGPNVPAGSGTGGI